MLPPLSSLKILDFSTLLPGPYATMMLADLGAEVLRIEAPNRPDLLRLVPPFAAGQSAQHALLGRSKRSLALDLKKPAGVAIVKRLIQSYDIVVEQFRPGVMARLGVGYDALKAEKLDLIFCSLTGYGQTGPYQERAGHDLNYLALAGVISALGRADQTPAPMPLQVADVGAGSLHLVIGLLTAVIRRQATGQGAHVDISMHDGALAWHGLGVAQTVVGGKPPERETTLLNGGTFYDFYETKDGRFLSVGPLEPKFWAGFCTAIERSDLIGVGLNLFDYEGQQRIKTAVRERIKQKELADWVAIFAQVDVCVEPVLTTEEAITHPQVEARGMMVDVPQPDGKIQRQVGCPIKISEFMPQYKHIGGDVGADGTAVLSEVGFSREEIEILRTQKVIN